MARLSIREQDRRIRLAWPGFRTIFLGNGFGMWRGRVYGLSAPYDVSIIYVIDHYRDGFEWSHGSTPEVRVLEPLIRRRRQAPEMAIPHVYDEGRDLTLCLFDPAANGWTADMAIADTTIPWIADWLRFYEAWQATGIWSGGGRDHEPATQPFDAGAGSAGRARRVEDLLGCSGSRCAMATRITTVTGPAPRWRLLDLIDSFRHVLEDEARPPTRALALRLAA